MYDEFLADIYDDLYVRGLGKDYATEAKEIAQIVTEHHRAPSSLLDVACGTGLHLAHLRQTFDHVEGLEISLPMLTRARHRLPSVRLHHGDMRTFRLNNRFDVVTCLFAAAGYVGSLEELREAMATMASHLKPGGLLIVEPWRSPDTWTDDAVHHVVAETAERTIVRMTHSTRDGRRSRKETAYLVGEPGRGLMTYRDDHVMTLATTAEYVDALLAAGCEEAFPVPGRSMHNVRVLGRTPS